MVRHCKDEMRSNGERALRGLSLETALTAYFQDCKLEDSGTSDITSVEENTSSSAASADNEATGKCYGKSSSLATEIEQNRLKEWAQVEGRKNNNAKQKTADPFRAAALEVDIGKEMKSVEKAAVTMPVTSSALKLTGVFGEGSESLGQTGTRIYADVHGDLKVPFQTQSEGAAFEEEDANKENWDPEAQSLLVDEGSKSDLL